MPEFQIELIVSEACRDTISTVALKGIEEYNKGSYFEAHEYLEDAWNEDQSAARELYRAILTGRRSLPANSTWQLCWCGQNVSTFAAMDRALT